MVKKLSLKMLIVLALNQDGLCYKKISELTKFHPNTVSRYVSQLDSYGLIEIYTKKSNSLRGRKWTNYVKLKKEFFVKEVVTFFSNIAKQLKCQLNDLFVNY